MILLKIVSILVNGLVLATSTASLGEWRVRSAALRDNKKRVERRATVFRSDL